MGTQKISRRGFLRVSGASAALFLGSRLGLFGRLSSIAQAQMEPYVPDAEISLTATEKSVQILPGAQTRVWGYEGELLSGSGVTLQAVPGSYLGPVLRVQSGKKLRINFHNNLPERSVVHPHGLRVPENCDGSPMQAIDPGQTKVYNFQVIDRASPAWFHPHPMMRTAEQVVMGLAGLFYVTDPEEEAAIPGASTGAHDIPVIIQDRMFDSNNQFLYQPNMMWGYLGDHILVNGQPDTSFSLEPRAYRLRFLNGSNARTYKLAWSNGMPLQVIGSDSGLLPAALSRSYVMLMPGERVDVWADFSSLAGKGVTLVSLPFEAGGMGMGMMGGMGGGMGMMGGGMMGGGMGMMGGGMMGGGMGMMGGGMMGGGMGMMGGGMMGGGMGMMGMGSTLANGAGFDILTVQVGEKATAQPVLGPLPALSVRYDASNVSNFASPRPYVLSMGHMMTWMINGRVFNMTEVAEDEKVNLNEPIAWEWVNASPIPHPMHIHNVQFQVVQRAADWVPSSYASVNQGFVDSGWKDTVLVWPGERVKIAMNFGPHAGMYMYHCHILEHEDMTMMRNLLILDSGMPGMPDM